MYSYGVLKTASPLEGLAALESTDVGENGRNRKRIARGKMRVTTSNYANKLKLKDGVVLNNVLNN